MDAAVIGGRDRWARRLRGLRAELQAQLRDLEKEDDSHRAHIERRIQQLKRLEHFALPLIEALGVASVRRKMGSVAGSLDRPCANGPPRSGVRAQRSRRAGAHARSRPRFAR